MGALAIDNSFHDAKIDLTKKFIEYYKIQLSKKEILSFDILINKVFYYFDLPSGDNELKGYLKNIYNNIYNYHFIKKHIRLDNAQEYIFCSEKHVMKDYNGKLTTNIIEDLSADEYTLALETLTYQANIEWNFRNPFVSFKTIINNQKFRATLIHNSLTNEKKPRLFLRKISKESFDLQDFNLSDRPLELINEYIQNKNNIIITGATSSGKTSFLRAILNQVNSDEHIIIMEDTCELELNKTNFTHLLSDDSQGKSLKDYCAYSLRMRPDRCILGEIRSAEVIPYILSMNTGHKGMMASLHANGPLDTVQRLATLFSLYSNSNKINYEVIMKLLTQCMDIIIHMENKKVSSISKVVGIEGLTPIIRTLYDVNESR